MFSSKKPHTAVTANIDRLCQESMPENDYSGIPDLIEVISIQSTGPTEAARAIRKKLKYGQTPVQLRALTVLDALLQNAGSTFQNTVANDSQLMNRLQLSATEAITDAAVKRKLQVLFAQWNASFSSDPRLMLLSGLQQAAHHQPLKRLDEGDPSKAAKRWESYDWDGPRQARNRHYDPIKEAKKKKKLQEEKERMTGLKKFEVKSRNAKSAASSSSQPAFSLKKERPALQQTLAQSHLEATALMNSLQHHQSLPSTHSNGATEERGSDSYPRKGSVSHNRKSSTVPGSISADPGLMSKFNSCKALRRQVLRYIENISDEQWLGGLISANEVLVNALKSFEVMDGAVDAEATDSDSDEEFGSSQQHALHRKNGMITSDEEEEAGEEEDENDPFADRNAIT